MLNSMKIEYDRGLQLKLIRIIQIWLILALFLCSARAQERPLIEVRSVVDTAEITIGDRILYSIIIDRQKDLSIVKPGEGLNLGMFEIKEYNFHEPRLQDDRIIERYDFNISVYDTGRFTIPPFPVAWFSGDSSKANIIEAPPIDIFVKSVISGDEAPELKDIKPPLQIPFNYMFWITMGIIVLLLAVIGYLSYRIWKRRKEKGYLFVPPAPPRPAHEVALEELQKLFSGGLLAEGRVKEFFILLSQIIRTYIEGRYYVSALEETSDEILNDMKSRLEKNELLNDLRNILLVADLVKFAKHRPGQDEIEQIKNQAINFVNDTKIIYGFESSDEQEEKEALETLPGQRDEKNTQNQMLQTNNRRS